MKSKMGLLFVVFFIFVGCSHNDLGVNTKGENSNEMKVASYYDNLIGSESVNIAQLNLFFEKMPKGGDLHHHYSGSIYAESYLDWVEQSGKYIDKVSLKIANDKNATTISVSELKKDTELYRKLLTLWSDLDYSNHYHEQISPDLNFFNTFGYFGPISGNFKSGLEILKNRAIKENVSYIETMLKSVGYYHSDEAFDSDIKKEDNNFTLSIDALVSKINDDKKFKKKVDDFILQVENLHKELKIDDDQFMMRYQTYTSRNSSPSVIFASLYAAFKAAESSELIVGVNFVGPENGVVAIEDYKLHMKFFEYLNKEFPSVNIALHAGELTLGMVRPKNLNFHISQALSIGGAKRIGHGVDLPYEKNPIDLLNSIKKKNAVIEINLTSNEFILGVKGQEHPYLIYSAYDVPLIISTDDSGVSRNNLSREYVLLASRYKPSYKTIKKYVYNSIKYSFLLDKDKEKLRQSLEKRFELFESQMAKYAKDLM